jgi:hypothetical protein
LRNAHPELGKRGDLVLHERDQRGYHQRHPFAQQGGDLVAQGLAAARGHQHQRVAAARDVPDHLGLLPPERRVAEHLVEDLQGGSHRRHCVTVRAQDLK